MNADEVQKCARCELVQPAAVFEHPWARGIRHLVVCRSCRKEIKGYPRIKDKPGATALEKLIAFEAKYVRKIVAGPQTNAELAVRVKDLFRRDGE